MEFVTDKLLPSSKVSDMELKLLNVDINGGAMILEKLKWQYTSRLFIFCFEAL